MSANLARELKRAKTDVVRLRHLRNQYRTEAKYWKIVSGISSLFVVILAVLIFTGRSRPRYATETTIPEPTQDWVCDDGQACQYSFSAPVEARYTGDSFVLDDRQGLDEPLNRKVLRWAAHHKKDFDKLMFGTVRVDLSPPAVIGLEQSAPGSLSGDAVGGGFSCGHDCHVRGPVDRVYKTILRHELAHVLIYRYFNVSERWIHEGTAEWFEGDSDFNEQSHSRLHGGGGPSVAQLFAGRVNDHFGMYVMCASVVDYLVKQRGGSEKYATYLRTAGGRGLTPALKEVYDLTPSELDTAYRADLCDT
jgi:hypothetical protein